LVSFGVVKKSVLKHFDIKQEVLFADFKWDAILQTIQKNEVLFKEIPKYPTVKRDLALLINEEIAFKEVLELAFKTEKKMLKDVNLFDVYQGKNLPEGKKSYAVSFTLQDSKGTLTDKQIVAVIFSP